MMEVMPVDHLRPEDPVPDEFDVLCEQCSYSLVGLTCDRCPECGHPFDHTELPLARVPWLYRRRIGYRTAYGRTWRMIVFHPRAFAAELCRPVRISQEDARLFRIRTIRRVMLTAMVLVFVGVAWLLWAEYQNRGLRSPMEYAEPYVVSLAGFVGGSIAGWIFLLLATDLPTFIWRGLDKSPSDLAPLHHYACAPLALVPYILLFVGAMILLAKGDGNSVLIPLGIYTGLICLGIVASLLWIVALVLMRTATGCTRKQCLQLALYLPFHWIVMALLSLLIIVAFTLPTSLYFSHF
jgi:hypothetical protein